MATSSGKRARKTGGNRYACKRAHGKKKHRKIFTDNKMTSEEYSRMKLSERKKLKK